MYRWLNERGATICFKAVLSWILSLIFSFGFVQLFGLNCFFFMFIVIRGFFCISRFLQGSSDDQQEGISRDVQEDLWYFVRAERIRVHGPVQGIRELLRQGNSELKFISSRILRRYPRVPESFQFFVLLFSKKKEKAPNVSNIPQLTATIILIRTLETCVHIY